MRLPHAVQEPLDPMWPLTSASRRSFVRGIIIRGHFAVVVEPAIEGDPVSYQHERSGRQVTPEISLVGRKELQIRKLLLLCVLRTFRAAKLYVVAIVNGLLFGMDCQRGFLKLFSRKLQLIHWSVGAHQLEPFLQEWVFFLRVGQVSEPPLKRLLIQVLLAGGSINRQRALLNFPAGDEVIRSSR